MFLGMLQRAFKVIQDLALAFLLRMVALIQGLWAVRYNVDRNEKRESS